MLPNGSADLQAPRVIILYAFKNPAENVGNLYLSFKILFSRKDNTSWIPMVSEYKYKNVLGHSKY